MVMVITKAAMGNPPVVVACRAFTASTIAEAAQTSNGLALAGINTISAARTASALARDMPGGPSMMTQS